MLRPRALRVAPIVAASAGIGKTMFVINLAAAAQRLGLNVLVLDQTHGDIADALGLRPRYELLHLMEGHRQMSAVALEGPESLWIIPASRGIDAAVKSRLHVRQLCRLFEPIASGLDLVIVNCMPSRAQAACQLVSNSDSGREIIAFTSGNSETIKASYSHIKQLVRTSGQQEFRLLINHAETEDSAQHIFRNVAKAAKDYIDATIRFGGFIRRDPALQNARSAHQTIFANRPGGVSAQAFDCLVRNFCEWTVPEYYLSLHSKASY